MLGECVISSVLSRHNKNLKQQTLKLLECHSSQIDHVIALSSRTDRVIALGDGSVLHLRVTAQFYLENKRKIHPLGMKAYLPKRGEETRESPDHLAPLFICLFLPLGLPCVNWASQERCLFYLRSSLRSLDLPLFSFHELFPSFSFIHHHSRLLFPILTT